MKYILFIDEYQYNFEDKELISLIILNSINVISKIFSQKSIDEDIKSILPKIKVSCYESYFKIDDLLFDYEKLEFYAEKSKYCELELNSNAKKIIKLKLKNLLNNDSKSDEKKLELEAKIKILENKKKNLENIQKEKKEEIIRKFNVDYDIYLNMQKGKLFTNEVPDLFKFKFEVFEEMSKTFDINDKSLCEKYYIKNYDRVNKSIGSDNYSKIFDQKEKEEEEVKYQYL